MNAGSAENGAVARRFPALSAVPRVPSVELLCLCGEF